MYTLNMNKQTLTERFEDYTEDTKQEEYGRMKSLVRKNCKKKNAVTTFLTWLVQSSLF